MECMLIEHSVKSSIIPYNQFSCLRMNRNPKKRKVCFSSGECVIQIYDRGISTLSSSLHDCFESSIFGCKKVIVVLVFSSFLIHNKMSLFHMVGRNTDSLRYTIFDMNHIIEVCVLEPTSKSGSSLYFWSAERIEWSLSEFLFPKSNNFVTAIGFEKFRTNIDHTTS